MAALCKLLPQGLLLATVVLSASQKFFSKKHQTILTVDQAEGSDSLKHIYEQVSPLFCEILTAVSIDACHWRGVKDQMHSERGSTLPENQRRV